MAEHCWEGEVVVEFHIVARVPIQGYVPAGDGEDEPDEWQLGAAKHDAVKHLKAELSAMTFMSEDMFRRFYDSPEIEEFEIRRGTERQHVFINGRYEIEKEGEASAT